MEGVFNTRASLDELVHYSQRTEASDILQDLLQKLIVNQPKDPIKFLIQDLRAQLGDGVAPADDPRSKPDLRRKKTKRKNMDLRRKRTKRRLLREVFDSVDTSGDGQISRAELLAALRNPQSMLCTHFPRHVNEIPMWIEDMDTDRDGTLSFDEFCAGAMEAISIPGGRNWDAVKQQPSSRPGSQASSRPESRLSANSSS